MKARRSAALAALLGTAACAATVVPAPVASDVPAAQRVAAGSILGELSAGRRLYVDKCSGCHPLFAPGARSPEEWRTIIEAMRIDAEVELTDAEATAIGAYLYAIASRSTVAPNP